MRKFYVILLVLIANMSFAQNNKSYLDVNYIAVQGEAKIEVQPDEFYLNIIINENQDKKISLKKLEKSMFKILKSLKVDVKDNLICKDYSTNLKTHFFKGSDVKQRKEYQLKLNSEITTNKVIRALKDAKIPTVSIEKVKSSKLEEFKRKARIAAIRNAKLKATDYTSELGVSLGKPLFISESSSYINNPYGRSKYTNARVMSYASAEDEVEVEQLSLNFEKIVINCKIEVRFKIED